MSPSDDVVLLGAATSDVAYDLARRASLDSCRWLHLPAELPDPTAAERAVRGAVTRFGHLDRVLWSERPDAAGNVLETDTGAWNTLVIGSLARLAWLARAAFPAMQQSGGGSLTVVLDCDAEATLAGCVVVSTVAAAMAGLIRALALDGAASGIRVNGVVSGIESADQTRPALAHKRAISRGAADVAVAPLSRAVTAADLAASMWFLSGPESGATTGTLLRVDGGLLAQRYRKRTVDVGER